jgi:hypothetical protein
MSVLQVQQGSVVRCSVVFTNTAGVATDPTTTVFRLRNPAGTVTTPAVTDDTPAGAFYVDVSIPRAAASEGRWTWRWEGTGTIVAAAEGYFEVLDSALD